MLTSQGFKLLMTLFIITVLASTVSVSEALTLSIYLVTLFVSVYASLVLKEIKSVKANSFSFSRKLSKAIPKKGEKFEVKVSVVNNSGRRLRLAVSDSFEGLRIVEGSTAAEKFLAPDESLHIRYVLLADERGLYRLGPLSIRLSDDYGMVCRYITLEDEFRVVVVPSNAEKPRLSDAVKKVTPILFTGSGSSYGQGVDDVFRELMLYEEGQPLKSIDWRRTAREDGELYVRKYEKLNVLRVLFLVDCTRSNQLGIPTILDSSISAVSAAASAMLEKGDFVVVATVGASRPGMFRASGMKDYEGLVKFLSAVSPGKSYDILEYIREMNVFDVAFMVGRFISLDGPTLKKVDEHFRRNGGVLFILVPIIEADNELEAALNELEKHRIENLKPYSSYVFAVKQRDLLPQLIHLHKILKAAA